MVPPHHRQSGPRARRLWHRGQSQHRRASAPAHALRVNHKQLATDASPDRNQQFLYISDLRDRFQHRDLPIISVDTKKRELVGHFKNPGTRWDLSPRRVNDHDFRSDAVGVAIPHGIYDMLANRGCVTVGVSHDTPAFAARAIARWWHHEGGVRYAHARRLLLLGDTGGSNGSGVAPGKPNSRPNSPMPVASPSP